MVSDPSPLDTFTILADEAFAQQRKHCLRYRNGAQKVYAEGPFYCIETATRRETVTLSGHAGVVDEDVEMAEVGIDILGGCCDGDETIKVDEEIANIAAFTFKRASTISGLRRRSEATVSPALHGALRGELHSAADFASMAEGMRQTILIWSAALIAASGAIGQGPGGQATGQPADQAKSKTMGQKNGQAKDAPRNPAQSPASQPRPQTVTPQTYSIEQIQAGKQRFASQCGFCHGREAAGGETGPDLTRSELVAEDVRGDKIGPLLRTGRPDRGMPAFELSDADTRGIVAFLHDQKTKFDALAGGRRGVEAADLATGDATAGRRYFNGAGGCSGCHSVTGDLAGIATRYKGLELLQRMLYPTAGRPAPALPKVTVTLASGENISGRLASEDEFTIVVLDPEEARKTFEKGSIKFKIDDPMSAHFDQLGKYTDNDMHNVFAYLDTLK